MTTEELRARIKERKGLSLEQRLLYPHDPPQMPIRCPECNRVRYWPVDWKEAEKLLDRYGHIPTMEGICGHCEEPEEEEL